MVRLFFDVVCTKYFWWYFHRLKKNLKNLWEDHLLDPLPLTTAEWAAAQWADASLKHLFKCNAVIDQGLEIKLIENRTCVCKDGWLVILKSLQVGAAKWYHHYLHHPGHTHLKETMNAAMYWKGIRTTIWSISKSCKSCQVNKRRSQKYGHLPPKTVYTIP